MKPNVLFIIADDYGYHDLSSRGSDYYETPNPGPAGRPGVWSLPTAIPPTASAAPHGPVL
ncbi:MAG: hypothetical protein U5K69_23220 [Balneolaceae bacterium]|nr:hypothetical protein [Balneolaceae bacterium]